MHEKTYKFCSASLPTGFQTQVFSTRGKHRVQRTTATARHQHYDDFIQESLYVS